MIYTEFCRRCRKEFETTIEFKYYERPVCDWCYDIKEINNIIIEE